MDHTLRHSMSTEVAQDRMIQEQAGSEGGEAPLSPTLDGVSEGITHRSAWARVTSFIGRLWRRIAHIRQERTLSEESDDFLRAAGVAACVDAWLLWEKGWGRD